MAYINPRSHPLELQKGALERGGVDQLFAEVAGGPEGERPQLKRVLSLLRQGDTFVVYSRRGLGLGVRQLIELVEDLNRRGIGFRSLKEQLNTTTVVGKLMFHAFMAGAEFERDLTQEKIESGRAKLRVDPSRPPGPKPKLDEEKRALLVLLHEDPSNSVPDICREFRISRATFFRYVDHGSKRKAGRKPKAKTASGLSTNRGRKVSESAPEMMDNAKHCPAIACTDSSSSAPPPASADASLRLAATVPSRPVVRISAEKAAA